MRVWRGQGFVKFLGGGDDPISTTFPLSHQCFQTSPLERKNKIANPKHTDGSIPFCNS